MKIDAVLSPPEIDLLPQRDLQDTTCVIFDILRATSSILTALTHGAQEIGVGVEHVTTQIKLDVGIGRIDRL